MSIYWQEEKPEHPKTAESDMVDLAFRITCPILPLDHAYALSRALHERLPWFESEPSAGIHLIHGAASGNGWYRPEEDIDGVIHLSRRTRMYLRVPRKRYEDARKLVGTVLDVDGYSLEVGPISVRELNPISPLFARYVAGNGNEEEDDFLARIATELEALSIPARKILCGRAHHFVTPQGALHVRSLLVADLRKDASLRLQSMGIGPYRDLGCGLFLPHKGITAVKGPDKE